MAPQTAWWREPTRKQWASFTGAWLAWILDAFDVAIFLLAMPAISRELGVSTVATTGSMALTLLARLAGGAFAGAAADKWGRKLPLVIAVAWFTVCDGLISVAPSFAAVLVLRTLFGLGMGAQYASGMTLAMENWPERSRGIASGVLQGSWAIGNLIAGVVAAYVLPRYGFRALFATSVVPAVLLVAFLILVVPESEEWLRLRALKNPSLTRGAPVDDVEPVNGRNLLWGCVTIGAGLGAYYALTTLYPTILETELGLAPARVGGIVALFYGGMLAGAIATGVIAARRGTTLAIVVPALLALPVIPLYVGVDPQLLAVGAMLGGAFGVGFCGVVPLLLTQLYPAPQRARLVGLSYHSGVRGGEALPRRGGVAEPCRHRGHPRSVGVAGAACRAGERAAPESRDDQALRAHRAAAEHRERHADGDAEGAKAKDLGAAPRDVRGAVRGTRRATGRVTSAHRHAEPSATDYGPESTAHHGRCASLPDHAPRQASRIRTVRAPSRRSRTQQPPPGMALLVNVAPSIATGIVARRRSSSPCASNVE